MTYSTDFIATYRRAAAYVDRILKGAKPADIPVEQVTRLYLIINLKTAKALGLTIPVAAGPSGSGPRVMDRRRFLLTSLAGVIVAPLAAQAQQIGKVHRIGLLGNSPEPAANVYDIGLRERGWLEGQNFVWERRFSEGRNERFPTLAADLVQAKPDVIITVGTAPTIAAKAATTTIPIIFHSVGDPVGSGIVVSLSRPGGNATGLGGLGPGMHGKMLELLKEALGGHPKPAIDGHLKTGHRR
jgi:ABC-type uncharacterized transport system substrate-binding protein